MTAIRTQLRQIDGDLLTDLNARLAEIEIAMMHLKDVAAMLTAARAMQQGQG